MPNADFYRIDTALAVPQVPKDSWSLRIHGMVDREITLTFADLLRRPMIERYITLSCVSNEIGGDLVGNALFQGVRFKDVLDEAGVQPGATQVVSRSIDGWSCGSPTSVIMDGRDAMIAIAMNGEPLPPEHGYPVRLVVPGLYGYVSATKWVTEIELTRWEDFDALLGSAWVGEGGAGQDDGADRPPAPQEVVQRQRRRRDRHRRLGVGRAPRDLQGRGVDRRGRVARVRAGRRAQRRHVAAVAVPVERRRSRVTTTCAPAPTTGRASRSRKQPKSVAPDGAQGYHQVRFSVD